MTKILVCGLGRCGLSLTMQILDKGGYPVFGTYPAYENIDPFRDDVPSIIENSPNPIFKIVDPVNWKLPDIDCRIIMLTRNTTEQAKSSLKFMTELFGMPRGSRSDIRKLASGMNSNARSMQSRLVRLSKNNLLPVTFENLIYRPVKTIDEICLFMAPVFLEISPENQAMLSQIIPRDAECHPHMLEATLLEAGAA